jgi:hypothetical protein
MVTTTIHVPNCQPVEIDLPFFPTEGVKIAIQGGGKLHSGTYKVLTSVIVIEQSDDKPKAIPTLHVIQA